MDERIRKVIEETLEKAGAENVSFAVERPTEASHGDYMTNAAMAAAKALKKNPKALAEELAVEITNSLGESASRVEVAGPGFINITLSRNAIELAISEAAAKGDEWGKGDTETGKRVMIEYGNPNQFKEMHVGHMMSSIMGEALSRLIENEGAKVARDTFGGDVGPHVAKAIWGLRKAGITEPMTAKEIGEAYVTGSKAYEDSDGAKAEIDALNKEIYAGTDSVLMETWRKGRDISMEEFRRIWNILGTKFDYEFYDSETAEPGLRIVRDGLNKGIFKESDGAVIYDGEGKGVHTMVFITSHQTPTYEAKDIGLAFLKEERWPSDRSIIITANEQTGRFKTVLAALSEIAPLLAQKTTHIAHGFLRLTTGKMSSREGNVITAAGLIKDVIEKAAEKNPDPLIAQQVAVGAIKFMVLRQSPGQDIIFDPEKSLSLEGDSGPYLQYALVRAKKILAYASEGAPGTEAPAEPYAIERLMMHFPKVAARAAEELSPNLLVTYLLELAGAWNSFYAQEQILGSPEEAYKQRMAHAFLNTMTNGLTLLGIPTPEKM
ncbi:MAG TPA: arginine--tRNA ligase [Candidatus Paceibacterota bacterium]|nr:arginine--tRNA ligase [Candidatus Paceibacterota bacterium]